VEGSGGWRVHLVPEGKNPSETGKNQSGLIVYVWDGKDFDGSKQEVSRVGWVRRNSKNPKTTFVRQLEKEVKKAQAACTVMNYDSNASVADEDAGLN
jgi:hypothetical protein